MINFLIVGFGGFIGSVARYFFGQIPVFASTAFPVSTLLLNFIGSFLIGIVNFSALDFKLKLFFKVGFCGGFTTFSTFSLEVINMIESGRILSAVVYCFASVLLSLFGAFLGFKISLSF